MRSTVSRLASWNRVAADSVLTSSRSDRELTTWLMFEMSRILEQRRRTYRPAAIRLDRINPVSRLPWPADLYRQAEATETQAVVGIGARLGPDHGGQGRRIISAAAVVIALTRPAVAGPSSSSQP